MTTHSTPRPILFKLTLATTTDPSIALSTRYRLYQSSGHLVRQMCGRANSFCFVLLGLATSTLQQQQLATFATPLSSNYKHLVLFLRLPDYCSASLRTLVEQHLCNACVGFMQAPYPTSCHHQRPLTGRSTACFGLLQVCDEALPIGVPIRLDHA